MRTPQNVIVTATADRIDTILRTLVESILGSAAQEGFDLGDIDDQIRQANDLIGQVIGIAEEVVRRERSVKIKAALGRILESHPEINRILESLDNVVIQTDAPLNPKKLSTEVKNKGIDI